MLPTLSRKTWIIVAIVAVILVVLALLLPHLLKWVVVGAAAGAGAVVGARKRRKTADDSHRQAIAKEEKAVEAIQDEADTAVKEADQREQDSPQAAVKGLTTEERVARLEAAAAKLNKEN